MDPLETYLQDLAQIRASGANVKELSFYPALKDLLDAAGVGQFIHERRACWVSLTQSMAKAEDEALYPTYTEACYRLWGRGARFFSQWQAGVSML
jgi:hypothetical protein